MFRRPGFRGQKSHSHRQKFSRTGCATKVRAQAPLDFFFADGAVPAFARAARPRRLAMPKPKV